VPEYAVTAIGRDRPGIVAGLSRTLLNLGGNIEDSQMSILRGHFAVMLIVRLPGSVPAQDLEADLGAVRHELGLEALTVSAVNEARSPAPRPSHVLSVYGADHPGIVASMSAVLAAHGVNVTDLETRLTGSPDAPLYVMLIEVALGDASVAEVERALTDAAAEAEVEVSLRKLEAEAL
jgi:glycine cleavage system transcriptional repressor